MIRLFCGYDRREAIGFHVFAASVLEHTSQPVAITPLDGRGLPQGTNAFTVSRFLVPALCGHRGVAIFADGSDMLLREDLAGLLEHADPTFAVQVVKRPDYLTRHRVKYIGTSMECPNVDYPRKNWASLMVLHCGHPALRAVWSLERLRTTSPRDLLQLRGLEAVTGALPDRWNRLADEGDAVEDAAILHWTAGIPGFQHYAEAPGAPLWRAQLARMQEVP